MKTSNRALIGFGTGIAALIIISIALVLILGRGNPPKLPEDSPQGTVQQYLQAVQNKEYRVAYDYLYVLPPDPNDPDYVKRPTPLSYDDWIMSVQHIGNATWKASLGNVNTSGETASVEVMIDTFRPEGPFGNPVNSHSMTFFLKMINLRWLITSPTDLYWLYW